MRQELALQQQYFDLAERQHRELHRTQAELQRTQAKLVGWLDQAAATPKGEFEPQAGLEDLGQEFEPQAGLEDLGQEADRAPIPRGASSRKLLRNFEDSGVEDNETYALEDSGKVQVKAGMFADAEAMKEKLRRSIFKPQYNVHDFYHEDGCFQRVTRGKLFDTVTLTVIAANALWIWIDTDYNRADTISDATLPFVIAENFFCTFFTLELFFRLMSFKRKRNCLRDAWFVFDSFLVCLMVFETWVMWALSRLLGTQGSGGIMSNVSMLRMFRLLRLSRMARMARLLRAMPELLILVKGMVAATRSVFFVCFLLLICTYIFSIAMVSLSRDTEIGGELFPMVPKAMLVLLCQGALMDEFSEIVYALEVQSPVCMVLFLVFMLLAALTIMNMLIGVLCDMIITVSAVEKDRMQVSWVKEMLEDKFRELDTNGDQLISKTEFLALMDFPETVRAFERVGVDVCGVLDVADFLFAGGKKKMTFNRFMEVVLELRGSNQATVKDIVDLRKFVRTEVLHSSQNMMRNVAEAWGDVEATLAQGRSARNVDAVGYEGALTHL